MYADVDTDLMLQSPSSTTMLAGQHSQTDKESLQDRQEWEGDPERDCSGQSSYQQGRNYKA